MNLMRHLLQLTLLEWLVIASILVIVIALLLPQVQWASSGNIQFPVRVFVFDAREARPIPQARVAITRASPRMNDEFLMYYRERFTPEVFDGIRESDQAVTGDDGTAVISYRFTTGASHKRPKPQAHVNWVWVAVQADGYAGAVIPVRHESLPTGKLREQKQLLVPIGLIPVKNNLPAKDE